jgi:hypothetical protein
MVHDTGAPSRTTQSTIPSHPPAILAASIASRSSSRDASRLGPPREHHVLDQVRQPGLSRWIVRRADQVADLHRHQVTRGSGISAAVSWLASFRHPTPGSSLKLRLLG